MREEGGFRIGKPIDNSRVVRQVDPRSRREILLLILLVIVLAAGLGLYAWPALEIRRANQAGALLDREKQRLIEENLWRAIRYGMDGKLIDFERGVEVEARAELERVLEWTAPARAELGLDPALPELNGAQRALRALETGEGIGLIYRQAVEETKATYLSHAEASARLDA